MAASATPPRARRSERGGKKAHKPLGRGSARSLWMQRGRGSPRPPPPSPLLTPEPGRTSALRRRGRRWRAVVWHAAARARARRRTEGAFMDDAENGQWHRLAHSPRRGTTMTEHRTSHVRLVFSVGQPPRAHLVSSHVSELLGQRARRRVLLHGGGGGGGAIVEHAEPAARSCPTPDYVIRVSTQRCMNVICSSRLLRAA